MKSSAAVQAKSKVKMQRTSLLSLNHKTLTAKVDAEGERVGRGGSSSGGSRESICVPAKTKKGNRELSAFG